MALGQRGVESEGTERPPVHFVRVNRKLVLDPAIEQVPVAHLFSRRQDALESVPDLVDGSELDVRHQARRQRRRPGESADQEREDDEACHGPEGDPPTIHVDSFSVPLGTAVLSTKLFLLDSLLNPNTCKIKK